MLAPWLLILGLSLVSAVQPANVDSSDRVSLTTGGQGYPPK
jgi:hypothetical protein